MEQVAKETFENNMHHNDALKTISKAHFRNRECSVREVVYYILLEFQLRRIFPAVYFVNNNLPKDQVQHFPMKNTVF